jgi:hypothetical protein
MPARQTDSSAKTVNLFSPAFEESKLQYGVVRERSTLFTIFQCTSRSLVNHLVTERNVRNRHVVEVGAAGERSCEN